MKREIERRFLVRSMVWQAQAAPGIFYRQAYLHAEPGCTVRVRLAGGFGGTSGRAQEGVPAEIPSVRAWLTIKGRTQGFARDEFEYSIPAEDAEALYALATAGRVEKWRHTLTVGGSRWEIDMFAGENAGLVLAEIELGHEAETFEPPDWLGEEVTSDSRYSNACLARHPCSQWIKKLHV